MTTVSMTCVKTEMVEFRVIWSSQDDKAFSSSVLNMIATIAIQKAKSGAAELSPPP